MASAGILKNVESVLKTLTYTDKRTQEIIHQGSERERARQFKTLENLLEKLYDLKIDVVGAKMAEDQSESAIESWDEEFRDQVSSFEGSLTALQDKSKEIEKKLLDDSRRIREHEDEERRQMMFDEQKQIEIMKMEIKKADSRIDNGATRSNTVSSAKLPKLSITVFNGTHLDWLRFWNQFQAEIDRQNIDQVTKFSYLKELLKPKVRSQIDGLPFTGEGYERAKTILQSKFGKMSEIVNEHIRSIMELPLLQGTNPRKVTGFYEKLVGHVQALETMGKLSSIDGNLRLVLDKLPGIQSDLVRLDDGWQEWTLWKRSDVGQRGAQL